MTYIIVMSIFLPIMLVSVHFLIKDALAFMEEETIHKDIVSNQESESL
jgi:hypothetical protein